SVADLAHHPRCYTAADGAPGGYWRSLAGEFVADENVAGFLRRHGFRARLDEVEFAVGAVFRPFDIHWAGRTFLSAVVSFGFQGVIRQGERLPVADTEFTASAGWGVDIFYSAAVACIGHGQLFFAEVATQHTAFSLGKGGFVNIK